MNGTSPRYGGAVAGAKSPAGSAFYGPPAGQEFSPTSKPQPRSGYYDFNIHYICCASARLCREVEAREFLTVSDFI